MNKTEIYYFSGTGNSLVVARDIAERMEGNLIAIPSMMDKERITTDADIIGIVFLFII
jgi:flavodoxin